MNGRRARGATSARRIAAGTRLRSAASGAARLDTGAPVGAQAESDAHVTLAVAQILEQLAARVRQNGLAWFASRLAHVDVQPHPLTPMITTNVAALMTQQDLAAYLGCNVRTLRRWRHLGWVPEPIEIGGALRWQRATVDALSTAL